jgi:hypothetical protein
MSLIVEVAHRTLVVPLSAAVQFMLLVLVWGFVLGGAVMFFVTH